jgi:hypothetical protein
LKWISCPQSYPSSHADLGTALLTVAHEASYTEIGEPAGRRVGHDVSPLMCHFSPWGVSCIAIRVAAVGNASNRNPTWFARARRRVAHREQDWQRRGALGGSSAGSPCPIWQARRLSNGDAPIKCLTSALCSTGTMWSSPGQTQESSTRTCKRVSRGATPTMRKNKAESGGPKDE